MPINHKHSFICLTPWLQRRHHLAVTPYSAKNERWSMVAKSNCNWNCNSSKSSFHIGSWMKWPVRWPDSVPNGAKLWVFHGAPFICGHHFWRWWTAEIAHCKLFSSSSTLGHSYSKQSHDLRIWSLINCHSQLPIATVGESGHHGSDHFAE